MKSYKNLYPQIISFENLLLASRKARKGKRQQKRVNAFEVNLEKELLLLQRELTQKTYCPGSYTSFYIYDPKPRMISAAPYRDRVVHHALCNVIEPLLEKSFIKDSYANQKGKGTHRALLRYQQFARKYSYVLKCDIQKYFPSIDHSILKALLHKRIACPSTRWLIDQIIDNSNAQPSVLEYYPGDDLFSPITRSKGLPIGNLTSQFFANVCLNPLDHFIKEELGIKGYVRYVDDFVLLADDKTTLHACTQAIEQFLYQFRIRMHPHKTKIYPTQKGITFLGHRIFKDYRLLKKDNLRRFRTRLSKQLKKWHRGEILQDELEQSWQSWFAHARFSDTHHLRTQIFAYIESQGLCLKNPGRFVEQQ